ncbi:MAG: di-trans,poly-cis-decaprenylcistransferase [Bacteroidales bacterium]|nr:di-trans,poly-cis-decaprenylcistransferase [Bacteroidales bacterium]
MMKKPSKIPVHVSIIMDGNGRWAAERGKERVYGHAEGVESVRAVCEACGELGVKYLSLFAFSEENWGRPKDEVSTLMKLMAKAMKEEFETLMRNDVRLLVLGNRARIAPELNEAISNIEKATAGNKGLTMIVMLSYSGKWDILQAAKRMAEAGADDLEPFLVTAGIPDPDVIIRTSGEKRISNYFLWQAAYSEFVFTDTLWPDFRKESLCAALEEYASRDRRFGKVEENKNVF